MDKEELIEILRAFTKKQVEELNDKARMVFDAVMSIADERDELKEKIKKMEEENE